MFNKAASKLWLLRRLKKLKFEPELLCDFYKKEIRVLVEYAIPVWYSSLTRDQSNSLEKIQKFAVSLILNDWSWSYKVKCTLLSLEPLFLRRKPIALNFALRSSKDPHHSDMFKKKNVTHNTRNAHNIFEEEFARSQRFYSSPLVSLTRDLNKHIVKNKTKGL